MRKFFYAVALVLVCSVSAQAAVIYLKDGGQIKAQKVWREKGKVVVLLNRDSIATFAISELNMKKTFPPRKKRVKLLKASEADTKKTAASPPVQDKSASDVAQPAKGDKKFALPSLSISRPQKSVPKGAEEGLLRKQKREMEQNLKE